MKRHHWLLVAAAALFLAGWLVWNVLLVEEDISSPSGGGAVTPHAAPQHS
jgi:hypothetical protein